MLKAMKKFQDRPEYDLDTEISPAEQLHMQSTQYRELQQQTKREEKKLRLIKDTVLGGRIEPRVSIEALNKE